MSPRVAVGGVELAGGHTIGQTLEAGEDDGTAGVVKIRLLLFDYGVVRDIERGGVVVGMFDAALVGLRGGAAKARHL